MNKRKEEKGLCILLREVLVWMTDFVLVVIVHTIIAIVIIVFECRSPHDKHLGPSPLEPSAEVRTEASKSSRLPFTQLRARSMRYIDFFSALITTCIMRYER
jgi:hypothetical protein